MADENNNSVDVTGSEGSRVNNKPASLTEVNLDEEFLTICPRSKKYGKYSLEPIPLMVVRDGIETKPDINISINELNDGSFALINHTNTKYRRLSFTVNVIIQKDTQIWGVYKPDYTKPDSIVNMTGREIEDSEIIIPDNAEDLYEYKKLKLITMLDYWIRNAEPLNVVSKLIDVPNAVYYITANKKRKQDYMNYTVWELTFTKKVLNTAHAFNKSSKGVKQAIKKYEKAKEQKKLKKEKVAKEIDVLVDQFKKCNYKKVVYSKTKKVTNCVKILQTILYNEKIMKKNEIDGWYGNDTRNYVKKYQNKYAKLFNLKATGKLNKPTYDTMIGVRKPIKTGQRGNTRIIESNLPVADEIIQSE